MMTNLPKCLLLLCKSAASFFCVFRLRNGKEYFLSVFYPTQEQIIHIYFQEHYN